MGVTAQDVTFEVLNSNGQLVYRMDRVSKPSGSQMIQWDGKSNTGATIQSGYWTS